jgi:GTP pyrophosphokinase
VAPTIARLRKRHPKADVSLVVRAYLLAERYHDGQFRRSGEPYITHPVAVADMVADLGMDDVAVASALLHDVVEDTELTLAEVEATFGSDVARVVDGLTKLERIRFDSKEAQQAASVRKMFMAMATDWRVLVIKLCDRLHNMKTLGAMPIESQQRIAQETMDIYAPLAHRLGIQEVRWQLEDLGFATLHPRRYAEIEQMVTSRNPERELYLAQVLAAVSERLRELDIAGEVTGRPKHYWSIYEKMVVKGKEFDDIYDLVAIRVVVESDKDCWAALGCVHSMWSPIPGRFKDYINTPKFNLYQSIHTTVVGPQGKAIEVQIRTREMHQRAEYGIAAHWGYKEHSSPAEVAWLQRIVDWQKETPDPMEFLESLKLDLEQDEVFVFTPKGKVTTLPAGACPIDFAYAIHTEVGDRCIGAKVNGRLVPLDSKLKSGDTVEIFTSKLATAGPSRDWLKFVATPRARNKIRHWFTKERREDAIEIGREELLKALRREGLPAQKIVHSTTLTKAAAELGYSRIEVLEAAIGEGHVAARTFVQRLVRDLRSGEEEDQLPATVASPRRSRQGGAGVYVEGMDDVMVRLSRCCTPVPGDDVVGFVTRGRGVSVHRTDCANAIALTGRAGERLVEVEWDRHNQGVFAAAVEIKALDRSRLLADCAKVVSEYHLNILASSSRTNKARVSVLRFEFELADPAHLESVLSALRRLDGVFDAYRVLPKH